MLFPHDLPAAIFAFPRTNWAKGRHFPPPAKNSSNRKCCLLYAARSASKRWATHGKPTSQPNVIDGSPDGSLDVVDYALAVMDKVEEINDYVRDMYHLGRREETVYAWHEVIDDMTVSVMKNAALHATPTATRSLISELNRTQGHIVADFVCGGMDELWETDKDSREFFPHAQRKQYRPGYVERYMPQAAHEAATTKLLFYPAAWEYDLDGNPTTPVGPPMWFTADGRPSSPPSK